MQPPHPVLQKDTCSNQCFQKLVTTEKNAGRSASWEPNETPYNQKKENQKQKTAHGNSEDLEHFFFFKPTLIYLMVKQNKQKPQTQS